MALKSFISMGAGALNATKGVGLVQQFLVFIGKYAKCMVPKHTNYFQLL